MLDDFLLDKTKTKNWNVPDFLKNTMAPSDSKISWSFWEADDSEVNNSFFSQTKLQSYASPCIMKHFPILRDILKVKMAFIKHQNSITLKRSIFALHKAFHYFNP